MASLPPQKPGSQRQQLSEKSSSGAQEGPSSQLQQNHRRSSIPQSFTSEDSQTSLINHPSPSEQSSESGAKQHPISQKPKPQASSSDEEPKRCWICFSDDTEDTPTTSRWRSPCPCALKAHEACLLDWIADLEGPGKRPQVIQCPQCKAKLVCKRPRSLIADGVRATELAAKQMTLPFVVVTLAGTVITGCWLHGFSTIYLVFGPGDADRLLGLDRPGMGMYQSWGLALPAIPLVLVASRRSYRLVNQLFGSASLAYFYYASQSPPYHIAWPPGPAASFAALSWIRLAYNSLYSRYLTPLEKEWVRQVKPKANEGGEVSVENEDRNGIQVELGLQIDVEEEGAEELADDQQRQEQPPVEAAAQLEDILRPAGGLPPQHPGAHPPQNRPRQRAEEVIIDAEGLIREAIGALLFPTISVAMGALLKMGLPRMWTTPPSRSSFYSIGYERYPTAFLQSRFGRTILGGCLVVVLKDALQLYSKYQNAMSHKQRRIANYDELPTQMKQGQ